MVSTKKFKKIHKSKKILKLVSKTRKTPLIQIVDDHIQTAVSISQILDYEGYKTIQVYNALEAIEVCKKQKPDLLILDIRLNGLTGYDVAEKLPGQKILFITGYEPAESRAKEFKNSIGLLKKPLDMAQLLAIVKKTVGPAAR